MTALTLRLPEDKYRRLKEVAHQRGASVNRLIDEMATLMIAELDAKTRFLIIDPALKCFNRSYPQGINAELVEAQAAFRQAQGERILKLHMAGSIITFRNIVTIQRWVSSQQLGEGHARDQTPSFAGMALS